MYCHRSLGEAVAPWHTSSKAWCAGRCLVPRGCWPGRR